MSILADIRVVAAARRRGAPAGPIVRPRVVRDEEGTLYTIFPGKACAAPGCAVLELTSRNRYGSKTLCIEHGREEERNRMRGPRKSRSASVAPSSPSDPRKERLQGLFRSWVAHPDIESIREVLIEEMDHHELMTRLRRVLTPSAAPAIQEIPVEDPGDALTNPDHRSTRSEFLADADYYGA